MLEACYREMNVALIIGLEDEATGNALGKLLAVDRIHSGRLRFLTKI